MASLLNVEGTRNVARACRERGALMVTFGTDYIFDGTSKRPYREEDPANPLSVYGKTKWAAEQALREEGGDHLLVRTQWMFGPAGKNFIRTILEKARRGETLRVASDQVGCPTFSRDLAGAVRKLLEAGARGTVHFSSEGETSWFGLARHVLRAMRPAGGGAVRGANTGLAVPGAKAGVRRVEQGEVSRDHRGLPEAVGGSGGGVP